MTIILDAKSVISSKIEHLKQESDRLTQKGLKPKLGVILVGENPASLIYIKNKASVYNKKSY